MGPKLLSIAPAPGACLLAALLLTALLPAPVAGQGFGVPDRLPAGEETGLRVHLVTFENQPAEEAVKLVLPLLSGEGSVEVQPGSNTVVIRDTLGSLSRILPVLAEFDHPRRPVRVSVWLFRAHRSQFSPSEIVTPATPELASLVETLRRHLRYADYELLARDDVRIREGEVATLRLEDGFRVRFHVGTVLGGQRLRLKEFEVHRDETGRAAAKLLPPSSLNLWLDRPAVVALTRPPGANAADENALLVVIRGQVSAAEPPRER